MYNTIYNDIINIICLIVLPRVKFCFAHVNWFFTTLVNNVIEYFPAEYAIGVFSLENGIEDMHHGIVSAPIPLGYRREALETSQNTHNIPIECPSEESDFAVIYEKVINFLESRKIVDNYPPLYTTRAFKGAVQSFLGTICDAASKYKVFLYIYIQFVLII